MKRSRHEKKPFVPSPLPKEEITTPIPPINPEELFYNLSAPEQDTIIQLIIEDSELLDRFYDFLMGESIPPLPEKVHFFHFFPICREH